MLLGDFFILNSLERADQAITATISLNAGHRLFQGHFPGNPVVPGVCQVAMMKEILCTGLSENFRITEIRMIKFSNMMNPLDISTITCYLSWNSIDENHLTFSGEMADTQRVYIKVKGNLTREDG